MGAQNACLKCRVLGHENILKGRPKGINLVALKIAPFQPDKVKPAQHGAIAADHAERNDIFGNQTARAYKTVGTNARKLVHADETAQNGVISHRHMAAQRGVICHNDIVADNAVMRHMYADHKQIVVADACDATALVCSGVHGYMFTNGISRADLQGHVLTVIFQILRNMPDGCERKNPGVGSDSGIAGYNHMRVEVAIVAQHNIAVHTAIGADADIAPQLYRIGDHRCAMNFRHDPILACCVNLPARIYK